MRDILSGASKSAPGNHQCAIIWVSSTYGIVGVRGYYSTVKVVGIILNISTTLYDVGVGSAISECGTCTVLNYK